MRDFRFKLGLQAYIFHSSISLNDNLLNIDMRWYEKVKEHKQQYNKYKKTINLFIWNYPDIRNVINYIIKNQIEM